MRFGASISHSAMISSKPSPRCCFSLLLLIAISATPPLRAQNAPQARPENPAPYILHLYARLVELPTMILLRDIKKPTTLDPQLINIRLNHERPFHPTSLRLEGNDPLTLAILIDVSGDQPHQISALQKHFAEWVSASLHPQDHVSIYALDCSLLQTSNNVAADSPDLQKRLDFALTSPLTHDATKNPSCGKSIRLRGAAVYVMRELSQLPGRRTLLLVTGGRDGKGSLTWPQVNQEAKNNSVTVFALTAPDPLDFQRMTDIYDLTQESGGFLFSPTPSDLPMALNRMISLLRKRYILQFPMPQSLTPVVYQVDVTVPKFDAVIRPSGVTVPVPQPEVDHPASDLPSAAPDPLEPAAQPAANPPAAVLNPQ
jgi:hypothetical protein